MIPNQWYAVLSSKEVKAGRLLGVTRFSEKLCFWRAADGQVCCIADQCCHRGAALSGGRVCGGHAACPFHGFEYDASGRVTYIPANGRKSMPSPNFHVKSYAAKDACGFVQGGLPIIEFRRRRQELKDGAK